MYPQWKPGRKMYHHHHRIRIGTRQKVGGNIGIHTIHLTEGNRAGDRIGITTAIIPTDSKLSLTFSIRVSYLCPILSHSDCSVIYLKQNVTPKYYIQNKSTFYLSSNIKYEACNVMKRSPHLVIQ